MDLENLREWIYVLDTCKAIEVIIKNENGADYNVGTKYRLSNLNLLKKILYLKGLKISKIAFSLSQIDLHMIEDTLLNQTKSKKIDESEHKFRKGLKSTIKWML